MPTTRSGDADIAYSITGDGDPVLMIMGLSADSRMWMLQTPHLAEHYRCILFDNRGVGESSSPPGPYTMEQMAADALAVLDACAIDRAHVIGISMGGAIAQHLALKAPERIRSLLLAATWSKRNAYTQRLAYLGRKVAELGHDELVRASMLWLFTPKFIIEQVDMVNMVEAMALQMLPSSETFTHQLHAVLEHDVEERLSAITAPTHVISARRDIMVPPELGEQLAAAIPGATFEILEGAHAFNLESVEAFNAAVLAFLRAR